MIFAIADVHNHNTEWCQLLDKVGFDRSKDHLYLLGDLFNRGDEPVEAWKTYLDLKASGCVTPLMGNHELFTFDCLHSYLRTGRYERYFSQSAEALIEMCKDKSELGAVFGELSSWNKQAEIELNGERFLLAHGMTYRPLEVVLHNFYDFALPFNGVEEYFEYGVPGYTSIIGHHSKLMHGREDLYINDKKNVYMIDNGCGQGGSLVCMCLDTKEITYL